MVPASSCPELSMPVGGSRWLRCRAHSPCPKTRAFRYFSTLVPENTTSTCLGPFNTALQVWGHSCWNKTTVIQVTLLGLERKTITRYVEKWYYQRRLLSRWGVMVRRVD